ncbi:enoyl-CoA hydratase-related protein [Terracoccus luteus]|uniref:Crotonobetainyl-CoA hydratase/dehydration protein DpgD n=1 Tax=Terracoccus luteus TaxID=53356 RepID=A0A839Q5C2_9MICO|nr:enoyl-CoA hydratase-related protein [Terracoccus luteus]MBB2988392.1 crotonobetainyl-CoA hydratase/dehydration protein DpgD [Terracoccus luteus]MCP2173978.1 crotonobetainyl-CoA hydratase/dehydration protein DpgD [Terracoccus luteus]
MSATISDRSPVIVHVEGHVARITLNRPEVLNALDSETHRLLADAWEVVNGDTEVRVAVLTGAGTRAFCVGQDLKETAAHTDAVRAVSFGSAGKPGAPRLTDRFDITKPVVARVFGHVLGGGFELAMATDLIVAADDSSFGLPEALRGLVPGAGGVFRLGRQVPPRVALEHLLTGRPMSAERALHFGLVNAVVPREDLDRSVDDLVQAILRAAPLSVRAIKQSFYESQALPLPDAFARTYTEEERRRQSRDAREGVVAFAEKRDPVWTGS